MDLALLCSLCPSNPPPCWPKSCPQSKLKTIFNDERLDCCPYHLRVGARDDGTHTSGLFSFFANSRRLFVHCSLQVDGEEECVVASCSRWKRLLRSVRSVLGERKESPGVFFSSPPSFVDAQGTTTAHASLSPLPLLLTRTERRRLNLLSLFSSLLFPRLPSATLSIGLLFSRPSTLVPPGASSTALPIASPSSLSSTTSATICASRISSGNASTRVPISSARSNMPLVPGTTDAAILAT